MDNYEDILMDLENYLSNVRVNLKCPKCNSTKINYKYSKKLQHIGAYCENGHFIKWIKQTPETRKMAKSNQTLTLF